MVAADFRQCALGQFDCRSGVIPAEVSQVQKDCGSLGAGRDLVDERLEQRASASEIAGGGVAKAGLDQSSPASLVIGCGSALRRELTKFGRDGRSASPRGMFRRLLERFGDLGVGALGGEREMSSPLLGLDDDLAAVRGSAGAVRPDSGYDRRCQQRMREANRSPSSR